MQLLTLLTVLLSSLRFMIVDICPKDYHKFFRLCNSELLVMGASPNLGYPDHPKIFYDGQTIIFIKFRIVLLSI